jgi:hypothetical protein
VVYWWQLSHIATKQRLHSLFIADVICDAIWMSQEHTLVRNRERDPYYVTDEPQTWRIWLMQFAARNH